MARLSIVITAYNIESYLQQCLESVAAQTFADIEVLVVDDGSTDRTPELISSFAEGDARFIPILLGENSPGGVATAANAGLDRASGEWVGFVDGDDFIEPTMFESLVKAATSHHADLAMCQYREVTADGLESRDPADVRRWNQLSPDRHYLDVTATKRFLRFIAVPWRKLYRRSLLESNDIRFPMGDYFYEDNPFHWFALLSAQSIAVVPQVLYYHRIGRSGQTIAAADARLFKIFAHHATIRAWLQERQLLDTYEVSLLEWAISQTEWIAVLTPKELRRQLFGVLQPIFALYPPDVLARALKEGRKGDFAQVFSSALAAGSAARFSRALDRRPDTSSRVRLGLFHLRHSGVRHTLTLTQNTVSNRFSTTPVGKILTRPTPTAPRASSQADVMFGLMVLQQRLDQLEAKIDLLLSDRDRAADESEGGPLRSSGASTDVAQPPPGDS